jgi:hypothetical protein
LSPGRSGREKAFDAASLLINALGFSGLCQQLALVWVIHFPLENGLSTAFLGINNDRRES